MKNKSIRRKYAKKILALILCLITLITTLPLTSILAWTSEEGIKVSSSEGDDYVGYDGEKYYYSKELTHILYDNDGNIASYYTFTRTRPLNKYLLTSGDETVEAFCIEAGVTFEDSDGYISTSYNNSSFFDNLPATARIGIMTVLVYGWTNSVPDELKNQCNLDDYRLAAQLIIWEYQQQIRTSPTEISSKNGVDADTFYHAIKGRPAEYAYNYILEKISEHSTIPSFASLQRSSANTYTLEYNSDTKKYELTLTDTNNTLVDLKTDNSDITIARNGNKYTFSSSKMITDTVTITSQKDINDTGDAMLIWGLGGKQTMATGCQDPVTFYLKLNTETYGELYLTKESEDGEVAEIEFEISGNNLPSRTVTTDSNGEININDLLPGTYTITEKSYDKYVETDSQTVTIKSGQTSSVAFSNVLKKFNVTLTKIDSETGSIAQGDSTLAGAVYGIYNNGELIDTYTTDENGNFTTDYYTCGDNWTIQEITPSEGYNLDETIYEVGAEAKNYEIEHNTIDMTVNEDVIKGKIAILKHTDNGDTGIETPEYGAVFEIYLKSSGSYENAKDAEKQILTTDEDGYAETKYLPFGTYIVHQVSGWDNRELVEIFEVTISENSKTYKYLLNNKELESYVKLVKVDETGKNITLSSATFSLYKLNEDTEEWEQVSCKVGNQYVTTWTTDENGVAYTENKLSSGVYKVMELTVPDGFLQLDENLTFEISMNSSNLEYDEDWDAWITVTVKNEQPTGTLKVNKIVTLNDDVDTSLLKDKEIDFTQISFELVAKKDIIDYTDGSILYEAGSVIGTYNLEEDGTLEVKDLNMGQYYLRELTTIEGLILSENEYEVIFEQTDTTTEEYVVKMNIENKSSLVEISKKDITDESELEGAKLTVLDEEGNIIDTWISTKETHKIEGLEVGRSYILREESAPYGYKLTEEIIFTVTNDENIQLVEMKDMPILTDIQVIKIDSDTKEIIKSKFTFGLYVNEECTELVQQMDSNKTDGTVTFQNLRYGVYYIKELSAPTGYELSYEIIKVEINDDGVYINDILVDEEDSLYSFEFENTKLEIPNTRRHEIYKSIYYNIYNICNCTNYIGYI